MLKNNILVSIRNFKRNRLYTAINLSGLTAGFTVALLIGLYVADEWRFDAMHTNADRIFRLIEENTGPDGKTSQTASSALLIAERGKQDIAEIAEMVKMGVMGRTNVWAADPKAAIHERLWHADASFGKVFDFKWLAGDRMSALNDPNTVVVTQGFARRMFGTDQVLGKSMYIERTEHPFIVTGVLEDFPKNSSIQFPFAISTKTMEGMDHYKEMLASDWTSNNFPTWFMLQKDASVEQVDRKLNDMVAANTPKDAAVHRRHFLMPIREIHFKGAGITGISERLANPVYVMFLWAVALFLLSIACINYINLSTARANGRSKEIGVRKVIGAKQQQVAGQFLTEAYLMVTGSFLASLGLLQLMLPAFNNFTDKNLSLNLSTDPAIWSGVIGMVLCVGLLAGIYPAFYLSRIQPASLLRRVLQGSKLEFSLRKGLVVAQFGLSVLMMIATMVVWKQVSFLQTKNLGFDRSQLLVVDINSGKVRRNFETIKSGFKQVAGVKNVSVSSRVPGEWKSIPQVGIRPEAAGENTTQEAWLIGADADFLQTYQMQLISGRNIDAGLASDSNAVLLNETAARMLHITEASGQWVLIPSVSFNGNQETMPQPFRARVTGIVQDFNFQSLREKIAPLVLAHHLNPVHLIDYFTVRLETGESKKVLESLAGVLQSTDPGHLFEWHFLDDQWQRFYQDDLRRQKILSSAALVAIFIASLGLFGLATFTAEQRTKEIGIRKVLGATVSGITGLLAKDFLKLVLIAVLIASPVSYWLMQRWLSDFAYRIDLQIWMFGAVAVIAMGIAFFTISFQSVRAALANPVKSLRNE